MKTLNIYRLEPDQTQGWVDLIKWIVAWVTGAVTTVFGFTHYVSKYFAWRREQQVQFIERVIDNKVSPEINDLKDSIDQLKEAIWELKNKIKG